MRPGRDVGEPVAEEEGLVGGEEVVEELHSLEPVLGEGYEGGAVVGVVGGFDLGEHGVAFVGENLAGYVD